MSLRTRRVREMIAGRQTRFDVVISVALLAFAAFGKAYLLHLTWTAFGRADGCLLGGCRSAQQFDVLSILFVVSLAIGLTYATRAVLKMLNRRNAWTFALVDAAATAAALIAGLWIAGLI